MNQNFSSVLAQVSSNFTYVPALDGRMRLDKLFFICTCILAC